MPFRCLAYVAELFNNLVADKNRLYRKEFFRFLRRHRAATFTSLNQPLLLKCRDLSDYNQNCADGLSRRDSIKRGVYHAGLAMESLRR